MRTLLIDNHDSYTFNLFQLIAEVNGVEPVVVKNNDAVLTSSYFGGFDNIVISPGPGRPQKREDLGHVPDVLARTHLPVLGVCLGHQAIAHLAGARVGLAPQARHGYLSRITHDGTELFAGVPQEFTAVRYHSLCAEEPLPPELEATAWAEDGVIMGLRHRELPRWGVQFHPESIASEHGRLLVANFRDLTRETGTNAAAVPSTSAGARALRPPQSNDEEWPAYCLQTTVLPFAVPTDAAYSRLFASSSTSFWLDSSRVEEGLSRFSFMGDADGPLSETLTYRAGSKVVTVRDTGGVRVESGDIFEVLDRRLAERRVDAPDLPFDFTGGYVGYFGYEIKADCGAQQAHRAETADAMWTFADRLIAVDHQESKTYVLAVHQDDENSALHAKEWLGTLTTQLLAVQEESARPRTTAEGVQPPAHSAEPYFVRDAAGYRESVDECQRQLVRGESYEICLTNKAHLPFDDDDLAFYLRLREVNPAPYAALFRNGPTAVFCSSPERFLRIDRDNWAESKPIKGTAPRDSDPERDAALAAELSSNDKTRAENLMIVDLLRNDLGQVCEIGTVTVDRFMAVESYATVHQLVSTIRGRLSPRCTPVAAVRHCFPGGSMTGAPKKRTMEIIDRLETEARGIYSGSLGYFGLSGGADLNIVIRTAVRHGDRLSIGAGGAIVLDSDREEEYQEMLLKAAAPLRAWSPTA
ncbi:aminodeoxychorismate synthase component I [Streptomyces sp. ICBB 8177]|uniref:aminodeoxychorismate synthase component I n=1 Tax=Streptomyces sp. ICBB 8177 TaxID=563922 RepID=UPI000D67C732|nr:aminodeoxychorismate synthase component I [Streptomyces sp. ICBB 8177]PWI43927.1 aminodeoxychorismate synthase, component I [Streptomyces sp. ICBB 8177]